MLDEVARFQQDILRREVPPKQAEKDRTHAWTCEGCFDSFWTASFFSSESYLVSRLPRRPCWRVGARRRTQSTSRASMRPDLVMVTVGLHDDEATCASHHVVNLLEWSYIKISPVSSWKSPSSLCRWFWSTFFVQSSANLTIDPLLISFEIATHYCERSWLLSWTCSTPGMLDGVWERGHGRTWTEVEIVNRWQCQTAKPSQFDYKCMVL